MSSKKHSLVKILNHCCPVHSHTNLFLMSLNRCVFLGQYTSQWLPISGANIKHLKSILIKRHDLKTCDQNLDVSHAISYTNLFLLTFNTSWETGTEKVLPSQLSQSHPILNWFHNCNVSVQFQHVWNYIRHFFAWSSTILYVLL